MLYSSFHIYVLCHRLAVLPTDRAPTDRMEKDALVSRAIADVLQLETPDAIIVTSPDGTVLHWNNEAEKVFGYSGAEAVGQPLDTLIVPGGHEDLYLQFRRIALENGDYTFETTSRRKDGSLVHAVVTNKTINDEQGRAEFIVT